MSIQQLMLGAGGAKEKVYVDQLFSTYVYKGYNHTSQTFNNGVNLSENGGLVWIKNRASTYKHSLFDTNRGVNKRLVTSENWQEATISSSLTSFNTNGFTIGTAGETSDDMTNHVSWSFRKAKGFFDVCTWSGNNASYQNISHNLGSAPGCIIVKKYSGGSGDWFTYHRSYNGGTNAWQYRLALNDDWQTASSGQSLLYSDPTATQFQIGDWLNSSGINYVAYVFAHDDQQFGEGGNEEIIKCGSYTGNASSDGPTIDLGWEPQWLMIKVMDAEEDWFIWDHIRGMSTGGNDPYLSPNKSTADGDSTAINVRSNGFQLANSNLFVNGNNKNYLYVAIRREDGNVALPIEDPTKVFAIDTGNSSSTIPAFDSGFVVDMRIAKNTNSAGDWWVGSRITQGKHLKANSTDADVDTSWGVFDSNVGSGVSWNAHYLGFMWKRHAGLDCVTYSGNATSGNAIKHGLGQVPEMIWVKGRADAYSNWIVYHKDLNNGSNPHNSFVYLNNSDAPINSNNSRFGAAPTSTHFTIGSSNDTNTNNSEHLALLFSSVSGISSVGVYTGNGSTTGPTITTGFSPKFIIIRRVDTGDNWNVFDSNRGISGNTDSLLRMNMDNTPLNVANFVTPSSTGFQVVSTDSAMNANNGKFIYYAHA